ncbi:MAG: hypothetical protein RLZZ117_1510 [Cyanobacteriota bacterium]
MPSRPGRGRRDVRPDASPRLLHHLQALLALAADPPARAAKAKGAPSGRAERRRRQHLALSQRLLDPLPPALKTSAPPSATFWTALRWGGCGLILARVLAR